MSSLCIGGGLGALDGAMCSMNCEGVHCAVGVGVHCVLCSMNCEGVGVHCAVGVGVQWACSDLLK